jgi:hypothetical protein
MERTFFALVCVTTWLILTTSTTYADSITLSNIARATFSGPEANKNGSALLVTNQRCTLPLTFTVNNLRLSLGVNAGPNSFQIGPLIQTITGDQSNAINPFFAGNQMRTNSGLILPGQSNPGNAIFVGPISNGLREIRIVFDNPISTYSKDGMAYDIKLPVGTSRYDTQEVKLFGSINASLVSVPESTSLILVAIGLGLIARRLKKEKSR